MPSLKDIRKRIASVKNTQKITRAMKLVAAAKLRRAQSAIIAARPYSDALDRVIHELVARAGREAHPLLEQRDGPKTRLLVLTSDRGLAGAFNASICRATEHYLRDTRDQEIVLHCIGRKGRDYFTRRHAPVVQSQEAPISASALASARELANRLSEGFVTGDVDRVVLVYNEFKSAISQQVTFKQILPLEVAKLPEGTVPGDFVYEPSKAELIDHLLPLYVQIALFRAFLESIAAEFGARMSAMDNATRNANEMIAKLTLQYNRARQAAITKELLEIIGGAEALKG